MGETSWLWFVSPESTTPEHADDVARWAAATTTTVASQWNIECKTNVFYNNFRKHVKWTVFRVTGKDSLQTTNPTRLLISVKESELQSCAKKIRIRKHTFPLAETLYWNWAALAFQPRSDDAKATTTTSSSNEDRIFSYKIKKRHPTITPLKYHNNIIKPYYPVLNSVSQAHACVIYRTDEEMKEQEREEQEAFVPQIFVEPRTHYVPVTEEAETHSHHHLPIPPSKREKMMKRLAIFEYPM